MARVEEKSERVMDERGCSAGGIFALVRRAPICGRVWFRESRSSAFGAMMGTLAGVELGSGDAEVIGIVGDGLEACEACNG